MKICRTGPRIFFTFLQSAAVMDAGRHCQCVLRLPVIDQRVSITIMMMVVIYTVLMALTAVSVSSPPLSRFLFPAPPNAVPWQSRGARLRYCLHLRLLQTVLQRRSVTVTAAGPLQDPSAAPQFIISGYRSPGPLQSTVYSGDTVALLF